VKIYEQPQRSIQELHIAEELRFAKRMQCFNCLQLHEQTVIDEDVKAQWFIEDKSLVFDANYFLRDARNRSQFQLTQQTSFIDRLDQSWSLISVHFDGCSNDLTTNFVRLIVEWDTRRKAVEQKATKRTKIL